MEFGADATAEVSRFQLTNKALAFQIGANTGQNLYIDVPQLSAVKLGIENIRCFLMKMPMMPSSKLKKP